MNPIYVPLLSALAGALIGSLSSIATILIQARYSERRHRISQAVTLATEDYKTRISTLRPGGAVLPFSTFLHFQLAMLKAVEDDDLTPERLRKISKENDAMIDAAVEIDQEWRKREKARIQSANDS